jgi:hypothetical protein
MPTENCVIGWETHGEDILKDWEDNLLKMEYD